MSRSVKPPDERRSELLNIGIRLLLKNMDIHSISIKEIVQQANVATGLFYYYFPSKEVFFDEALNRFVSGYIDELITILTIGELPAEERIIHVLEKYETHLKTIAPFWQHSSYHTPWHHTFEDIMFEKLIPIVEIMIEKGVQDGSFHCAYPSVTARFIVHGLSGILHMKLEEGDIPNCMDAVKQLIFSALAVLDK